GRMSTGSASNSNEDSYSEDLDLSMGMMKIDLKKMEAAKNFPNIAAWCKVNCPTTSPGNVRTPPLPIDELFNVPDTSTPFLVSVETPTPANSVDTLETARQSEESASSPEISQRGSKKMRKGYTLKSDAQRQDPKYKLGRKSNNKSVQKWREKKKREEEEAKRKNEEEKELLRSTLKKLIEMHEWHTIEAEFRANGRVFNRSERFGVMSEEQDQLYKELRREVTKGQ
ncbi:hypothetical protein PFISCL1PPCAC_16700, partial [Pristionchus fissidentatus]